MRAIWRCGRAEQRARVEGGVLRDGDDDSVRGIEMVWDHSLTGCSRGEEKTRVDGLYLKLRVRICDQDGAFGRWPGRGRSYKRERFSCAWLEC